jgi:hypothetical protein
MLVLCSTWNKIKLKPDSSNLEYFRHLFESGLTRIYLIRTVCQFRVEQLISCQKCRAIACRAIAIRAVHPHSSKQLQTIVSKVKNFLSDWVVLQYVKPLKKNVIFEVERKRKRNWNFPTIEYFPSKTFHFHFYSVLVSLQLSISTLLLTHSKSIIFKSVSYCMFFGSFTTILVTLSAKLTCEKNDKLSLVKQTNS